MIIAVANAILAIAYRSLEDPVEVLIFPEAEKQTQGQTAESNLLVIKKKFSKNSNSQPNYDKKFTLFEQHEMSFYSFPQANINTSTSRYRINQSELACYLNSGRKIAPNTGANATKFFTLATKA